MAKRNLILGSITNYDLDDIKPFFLSLNKIQFDGKVCLIVGNNPPDVRSFMKEQEVEMIEAKKGNHYLHNPILSRFLKITRLSRLYSIFRRRHAVDIVRFFEYKRYLARNKDEFNNVLLTDVRDVIFQRDPFGFNEDKVLAFQENKLIKEDLNYNSNWIEQNYNAQTLKALEHHRIICSGTILGKENAVFGMLKSFCSELGEVQASIVGVDQGIFNFLVRSKNPSLFKLMMNKDIIYTMGCSDEKDFVFNKNNEIVDSNEIPIPILHQYDRFPDTTKRLLTQVN